MIDDDVLTKEKEKERELAIIHAQQPDILTRSNLLIEAKYSFTILSQKIMLLGLTKFQQNPTVKKVQFTVFELALYCGESDQNYFYNKMNKASRELLDSQILIEDPDISGYAGIE